MRNKPTLEEVKEHFKDADVIKELTCHKPFNINKQITKGVHEWKEGYWIDTITNSAKLWDYKLGYAEILYYKKNKPIKTKFEITKKQILQAHNAGFIRIKKWFPEAFKKELVVGKWYKYFGNLCVYNDGKDTYGLWSGEWSGRISFSKFETTDCDIIEATDQEVEAALIAEAKKRGFKAGSKYLSAWNNEMTCDYPEKLFYDPSKNCLSTHGGNECIFQNGKWAKIITTITREEAEKRLGVKIE